MADDGIKLTDAERDLIVDGWDGPDSPPFAAVESIVAARVQALTAERNTLRIDLGTCERMARESADAARAELAAANADKERLVAALKSESDAHVDERRKLRREVRRLHELVTKRGAAISALSARLERVRALADAGRHDKRGNTQELVRALDAALGEDA